MKAAHAVTNHAVRRGHVLAGAQKLQPGFHDEGFDKALRLRNILEDAPAHGAIAQANRAGRMNGAGEFLLVGGLDAVLDGDQ